MHTGMGTLIPAANALTGNMGLPPEGTPPPAPPKPLGPEGQVRYGTVQPSTISMPAARNHQSAMNTPDLKRRRESSVPIDV